jgi:putative flippase GtrA
MHRARTGKGAPNLYRPDLGNRPRRQERTVAGRDRLLDDPSSHPLSDVRPGAGAGTGPCASGGRPLWLRWLFALFIEPSRDTRIEFLRYLVTGAAAFAVDFGTLYALTRFGGVYYLSSAAGGFILGLIVNYILSRAWVFNGRRLDNAAAEFAVFAAIGLVGLSLNELGMWVLVGIAGLNYLLAKFGVAALVYFWNFGARKAILFR